jgi:hypothetical protein
VARQPKAYGVKATGKKRVSEVSELAVSKTDTQSKRLWVRKMAGKGHFELLGVWAGYVDVGFCAVVVPWLGWGDCWGWAVLVLCRDDFVHPLKIQMERQRSWTIGFVHCRVVDELWLDTYLTYRTTSMTGRRLD